MLTPEQEKFVADLFTIQQKQNEINSLSKKRNEDEAILSEAYKVNEINSKRADLVNKFNVDTAQLKSEIEAIRSNLTK